MKVNSKGKFEMEYSFLKPVSQNFEVLIQCGDVINPQLPRKRAQICISCVNDDRKINGDKSKKNFEMRHSFIKLFPRSFEILVPCCDLIISKFGQKYSSFFDPNSAIIMSALGLKFQNL